MYTLNCIQRLITLDKLNKQKNKMEHIATFLMVISGLILGIVAFLVIIGLRGTTQSKGWKVTDEAENDETLEQLAKRIRNQVSCETCKCLMNKEEAYFIRCYPYIFYEDITFKYYCHTHAPKYEKIKSFKFYKELEVTEQGEPIGYIKKK